MLTTRIRLVREALFFCLLFGLTVNISQAAPANSTYVAETQSAQTLSATSHNIETPYGPLSTDAINTFKQFFIPSPSEWVLARIMSNPAVQEIWKTLKSSELDFISYMTKRDEGLLLNAPDTMEHGLMLCLLSRLPGSIHTALKKTGMPECGIEEVQIQSWRSHYIDTRDIVSGDGNIYSFEKYAHLDPGWVQSVAHYLAVVSGVTPKFRFNNQAAIISVPDQDTLTLGLAGDWGTGNYFENGKSVSSSFKVMQALANQPTDFNVHLGDVYYSGTLQNSLGQQGEEYNRFLNLWKSGKQGSLALNSNHEMCSGGHGYFNALLKDPRFHKQSDKQGNPSSFFAIPFGQWVIIGLDTAYDAKGFIYKKGALVNPYQKALLKHYGQSGLRIAIMSHHHGMVFTGIKTPLWDQVTQALGKAPDYWYWGHQHYGIAFADIADASKGAVHRVTKARCVGNSGIPMAIATDIINEAHQLKTDKLLFAAHTPADASKPMGQILNGFAVVRFHRDGRDPDEAFYDEKGEKSWSSN